MVKPRKPTGTPRQGIMLARDIVVGLRAKILKGTFSPGQRLPTHVMIEKEFHSTPPTVAKALGVLKLEGFIRSDGRRGMFVTERPPHQHHYALAFAFRQDEHLSPFYVAMRNEAARFSSSGRHFSIFYEIGGHTDTDDYQRLLGFVKSHRLAGLIIAQHPYQMEGSPILEEPNVPRVIIASDSRYPNAPAVFPDLKAFTSKALDHLASQGRKRVSLITVIAPGTEPRVVGDDFVKAVTERGMVCRPYWIQAAAATAPAWAHNGAQLLMHASERPDAVVIADDNLVEHATAGIAASGVRVPEDVSLIAHTNFPWPTPSAVPVRRLGYDVRQLFEICVERIDALRRGEQPPRVTLLPPVFEAELETNRTVAGSMTSR